MKTWMDLERNKVLPTYQRHEQAKRIECCLKLFSDKEDFDVVFSDECSVMMEHFTRHCFHKNREP